MFVLFYLFTALNSMEPSTKVEHHKNNTSDDYLALNLPKNVNHNEILLKRKS